MGVETSLTLASRTGKSRGPVFGLTDWIYFLHPHRANFAATMTDAEQEVLGRHFLRLRQLLDAGG